MTHYNHPSDFANPDHIDDPLYVITTVYNPHRYRTRWKLYKEFERHMLETKGVILVTVECAYGDRQAAIEQQVGGNHVVIPLHTEHELWIKENLNNIGLQRLPRSAKYVAFIDADFSFSRPDWAYETIQQLQHYDVVQMFSEVINLTPDFEEGGKAVSFMEAWRRGVPVHGNNSDNTFYKRKDHTKRFEPSGENGIGGKSRSYIGAPGGAWAYKKDALNKLGGLLDFAILGSADNYMAFGMFGMIDNALHNGFTKEYRDALIEWQENAVKKLQFNVGHVKGVISHHWHGKFANRQYDTRNQILIRNQFNPHTDLKKDSWGIYQLAGNKPQLRDDIRSYFSIRNEDSIEI